MKKLLALILAVIMIFSMTSVSYAADAETAPSTINTYMDYLEEKLEDDNFFVKLIARLVIIGVMLGFIDIEDFDAWFDNTAPEPVTPDTSDTWEDGTELKLHSSQTLPYEEDGITITDIKITKEHYNGIWDNKAQKYKYNITIEGKLEEPNKCNSITLQYLSNTTDGAEVRGYTLQTKGAYGNTSTTFTVNDDGDFRFECCQYNVFFDYDTYYITEITIEDWIIL